MFVSLVGQLLTQLRCPNGPMIAGYEVGSHVLPRSLNVTERHNRRNGVIVYRGMSHKRALAGPAQIKMNLFSPMAVFTRPNADLDCSPAAAGKYT